MENSTDLFFIPIALIAASFMIRWYAVFVDRLQNGRDRKLREIKITWLHRCYSVSVVERLDRAWYKQTIDDKYNG